MFKEILRIDSSEFLEILKNPSNFLSLKFDLEFTNNEIYLISVIVLLFILGLIIDFFKPKEEVKDQDLPDNVKGLKDIGSNSVIQKIDLATAYMNMGKSNLAKKILQRLENNSLTKFEKNELSKLKKQIDND
tara:strand:- start:401 stop:796 length:396 start_codon:yes stop_codon:yes gene_type:complete